MLQPLPIELLVFIVMRTPTDSETSFHVSKTTFKNKKMLIMDVFLQMITLVCVSLRFLEIVVLTTLMLHMSL